MTVYTYSDARQNLASLLEQALREGEVRIRRKDGRMFVLRPEISYDSPLSNLGGVDLGLTTEEIVRFVRESREAE
jgi:PAS domain-containing protein